MGDAFRRLFLSIGVALGLASGQSDPSLYARLDQDSAAASDRLAVSARVENAFAPGALELVETGTAVALRFTARILAPAKDELVFEETRALRFDMRSGLYDVSFDGGRQAALVDPEAARTLASQLPSLELCPAAQAPEGTRVVVESRIGILDARGEWHDAPVLWNYYVPRMVLERKSRPDIPPKGGR